LISHGKFDELKDLVAHKTIEEIKKNYSKLSCNQRNLIAINPRDIFTQILYEFKIFENENKDKFVKFSIHICYIPYSNIIISHIILNFLGKILKFVPNIQNMLVSKLINIKRKRYNDILVADYK
jgi:hypothetical protein